MCLIKKQWWSAATKDLNFINDNVRLNKALPHPRKLEKSTPTLGVDKIKDVISRAVPEKTGQEDS